jgi:hypothetical protein
MPTSEPASSSDDDEEPPSTAASATTAATTVKPKPSKRRKSGGPSPQEVVRALCGDAVDADKQKTDKDGVVSIHPGWKVICPKPSCGTTVHFFKKSGFMNPYDHLMRCFGSEANLLLMYEQAKQEAAASGGGNGRGNIRDSFQFAAANPRDQAICDWVELIVMESLPLNTIEKKLYRNFSKHNLPISAETLKGVLFALVELVEDLINDELKAAKCGATMHDAWTKCSVHYMALFACYIRLLKVVRDLVFHLLAAAIICLLLM